MAGNPVPRSPNRLGGYLTRKQEYIFNLLYDTMHDKNLSRQDFKELQKRMSDLRNLRPASEENRKLQTRIGSIWSGLMKSSRHYRKNPLQQHLNVPEWLAYWSDFVKSARSVRGWPEVSEDGLTDYQWHNEFIDLIFDNMDYKGDESLDKEEYSRFMKAFGLSTDRCEETFLSIVNNTKNGQKIDRQKFKDLWFEFLTNEKEDGVGNFLFGNPLLELVDET
ncbi:hypothetical protein LOTGIDRAFT_236865 [Lottia gigantea]|uniref:EF-hand domain-containing protein n=1 Tax=Lottia gigantea TaxID=225164 RepID=V3ZG24_LOTGI|nr:hypothetical protein LOTGIDRAFT_236865 [Lottia gigantea]ESO83092.1 hypothetical protein LOTGIDRAFT_236865 [Lottia gigantea]